MTLEDSLVKETAGTIASAIYLQIGCKLVLKNTTMHSIGHGSTTGDVIVAEKGSIEIENSSFYDN